MTRIGDDFDYEGRAELGISYGGKEGPQVYGGLRAEAFDSMGRGVKGDYSHNFTQNSGDARISGVYRDTFSRDRDK